MIDLSVAPARTSGLVAARTRLLGGVLAGPAFVVAVLVQAAVRDGFEVRRHPLSLLSLGDRGWVQIANFVLAGLLFVVAATGLRQVLTTGRASKWGPRLIGGFGACLIWAGVFVADPADGFPVGTPDGAGQLSWHGIAHSLAPALAFLLLGAGCVVFARRFAAQGRRGWAAYCVVTLVSLLVPNLFATTEWFYVSLYVALAIGWGWASAVIATVLAETAPRRT